MPTCKLKAHLQEGLMITPQFHRWFQTVCVSTESMFSKGCCIDASYSLEIAPQVCVSYLNTLSAYLQHVDLSDLVILPLSGGCPG